eukprot:13727379-Alexandrium_andersonii.AAC.1
MPRIVLRGSDKPVRPSRSSERQSGGMPRTVDKGESTRPLVLSGAERSSPFRPGGAVGAARTD